MKKQHCFSLYVLCLLASFAMSGSAQSLSIPFTEYFNEFSMPVGWSQQSNAPDTLWNICYSNYAGGYYNEACVSYQANTGILRLVTPALNTAGITDLILEFKHAMYDYAPGLTFLIQSSADGTTWTDETWSITTGGGNLGPEQVNLSIGNNLGGTTYLAFTVTGDHNNFYGWYIDDVEVYPAGPPSCPAILGPAEGVTIQGISVMLDWQGLPNADDYILYVGTDNPPTNLINGMDLDTATQYLLENLTVSTEYYWIVVPSNTSGSPGTCPVHSFTTYTVFNLPYTENFDGTAIPSGWQQQSYTGNIYWSLSLTNNTGGTANEMLCGSGNSYDWARLVLPPVNTSGLTYLNLAFRTKMANCDWGEVFYIQTSTDGVTWTNEPWFYNNETGLGPMKINTILQNNLGGITYVAFYVESVDFSFDFWSIDEVQLDDISAVPECSALLTPSDGATEIITYPFVMLQWDAALGSSAYQLFVGTDNPPTNTIYGLDMGYMTSYAASYLTLEDTFYWQVVPYNIFGNANNCPVHIFSTISIQELPYISGFDEPVSLNQWNVIQPADMATVSHSNTSHAGGSSGEVSVAPGVGNGILRMISPPLNTNGIWQVGLRFRYYFEDAAPGLSFRVQAGYDGVNWTDEAWSLVSGTGNSGPEEVHISVSNVYYPTMYIAFVLEGEISGFTHLYVDDFKVYSDILPPCANLVSPANNVTNQPVTMTFNWNASSYAEGYHFFLGTDNPPTNFINGQDLGDTTSLTIASLDSATTYFWRIVAYNIAGQAANCPVRSFTTIAPPPVYPIPFTENFVSNQFPGDWTQWKSATIELPEWSVVNSFTAGGQPNEMYGRYNIGIGTARLITPFISTSGLNNIVLTYKSHFEGLDSGIVAKVQSSNDGENWIDEAWQIQSSYGEQGPETVSLMLTANMGSKKKFSFTLVGDFQKFLGWYIDNVEVNTVTSPPGCATIISPSDSATNVLPVVDLHWTAVPGAAGYRLFIGTDDPPANLINGDDLGNLTHYEVQNLGLGTDYHWKVVPYNPYGEAQNCQIYSFSTYAAFTIPYIQNFPNSSWPLGWSASNENALIDWTVSNSTYAGGPAWEMKGWASPSQGVSRLITPAIQTNGVQHLNLRFTYYYYGYGANDVTLKIQSSSDGTNWTNEIWHREYNDPVEGVIQVNTTVSNNLGSNTWIAFVAEGNHGSFVWWYIDNVEITLLDSLPECITGFYYPTDQMTEMVLFPTPRLQWSVQNHSSGYKLNLGTDNPPSNILNNYDLQSCNYYYLDTLLTVGTKYYWQVVPYSPLGQATGCTVHQFSTVNKKSLPFIDSFEDDYLQDGWSQVSPQCSFSISISSNAGGSPNEVSFEVTSGLPNKTVRLITPPVNTTGASSLNLSFRYFTQTVDSGVFIKIQTSSDGLHWNDEAWQLPSAHYLTSGPQLVNIPLTHYGSDYTYVAFTLTGQLYQIYQLFFDDIVILDTLAPSPCVPVTHPLEGDTGISPNLTFTWQKIPLATSYLLSIGTDTLASNILYHHNTGDTNSFPYCCLYYDTAFHWKIEPVYPDDTAVCDPVMFTTTIDPIQQLPYVQHLDSIEWPFGWKTFPEATWHWGLDYSDKAGGQPNEFYATYELIHMIKTIRLISPPLNTSGETSLNLIFNHYFDGYDTGIIARIQSSTDAVNWIDEEWYILGSDTVYGPEEVFTHITHNLGDRTYISWSLIGDQYNFDAWYVDDILIYGTRDHDVGVNKILLGTVVNSADSVIPGAWVKNYGMNTETFNVTIQIPGGSYSSTKQVTNLTPGSKVTVEFDPVLLSEGVYSFKTYTEMATDQFHKNDTMLRTQVHAVNATWVELDTIPATILLGSGAVYKPSDTTAYFFTSGGDSPYDRRLQRFNLSTEEWDIYDTLPTPLRNHASAIVGEYLYLIGGTHSSLVPVPVATVSRFHLPTHTWDTVQPLPYGLRMCKAVSWLDSLIYVAGGIDPLGYLVDVVWLYNINTNQWRNVTTLPFPQFAGAFSLNAGRLIYAGGADEHNPVSEVYTAAIDSLNHVVVPWATYYIPSGPCFRFDAAPWGDSAVIMTGGGENEGWFPDNPNHTWVYNLLSNTWHPMPDLPHPVVGASCGSSFMGTTLEGYKEWKLVVAGGYDGQAYLDGTQVLTSLLPGNAPAVGTIIGNLRYDNMAGTGLPNCTLTLKEGNTVVATTTSIAGGSFSFTNIAAGNYSIQVTTNIPWGGGNAVDALLIMKHFVGMTLLTGLKLTVADVDASTFINAIDGLNVMRRFVGLLSSFASGDWKFETPAFSLAPGENKTLTIKGLCFGDVDASYNIE